MEDERSKIFLKGWSTKGENRGIGLWLVRKTVTSLGGTIEAESAPGSGSSFEVKLPLPVEARESKYRGDPAC
mgnify:FL=1